MNNEKNKNCFLKKIEIINLMGGKEISINFENKVTFLTGVNGSGKSTLLNLIFDSLITNPGKYNKPATCKVKFWASKAELSSGAIVYTHISPAFDDGNINEDKIESILTDDFYDKEKVTEVQRLYENVNRSSYTSYVDYKKGAKGEWWRKKIEIPEEQKDACVFLGEDLDKSKPIGFIYQEDRVSLHSSKDIELELEDKYWAFYRSSIDTKLQFIRDSIQIRESHLSAKIASEFSKISEVITVEDVMKSKAVKDSFDKLSEINKMIELLNEYFSESGKKVVRDDDNKLTLTFISNEKDEGSIPLSWKSLSRGEKTLLYLFLSVCFYKDKVAVFLFDEPEISFHVSWQRRLIKDVSSIAPNNQFIIATHSPSLVIDGWASNCLDVKA